MLDTVILSLDISEFRIMTTHYSRWSPDITYFFKPPYPKLGGRKYIQAVRTATKDDKKDGLYIPRIKLIRSVRTGGYSTRLYVEFSAPKILFNNNFDELADGDFDSLCKQLSKVLRKLGVVVNKELIKTAQVNTIHYSKNIILTDGRLAKMLVRKLAKTNVSSRRQTKYKTYGNDGEAMYFHTNKWAFVAYDKLAEFRRSRTSPKGLFEKDYYCQLSLFDEYTPPPPFEVIRLEVRYIDRKTIKSNLHRAGITYTNELTFIELYSEQTAKAMLLHELAQVETATPNIMLADPNLERFVADLVANNPNAQRNAFIYAVGLKVMLEQLGSRGTRSILNANSSQWSRLTAKTKSLDLTHKEHDTIATMRQSIVAFRRIKLTNYQGE
jgi:hypothetical protein